MLVTGDHCLIHVSYKQLKGNFAIFKHGSYFYIFWCLMTNTYKKLCNWPNRLPQPAAAKQAAMVILEGNCAHESTSTKSAWNGKTDLFVK